MARKPNYNYEKRQRELAKKAKKEEKLMRRQAEKKMNATDEETADGESSSGETSENIQEAD
ncbi:hypothetical protein HRM2_28950 [Desulforapulum autotrophicum HRM2]|uniref:Uncharacterized protein n=1 Tax=Desulforapulum autotrophicum (strain ATCC 43914 / DSM 3382 / VKM B-1955 / HRM2) TaxID=177437 RepID=C0QJH0_DESAH|nr:hypothetical protein [Desulforapulum autotrophicum]ACN15983.1 hypothetical protein HRM2_28950 [Desulforapulum autotrophicum HRM2]